MTHVDHFAHGWINPALAFIVSFLGWLLGLVLVDRARQSTGLSRARWLIVAAVAIGGIGIWLMQFMAMLGFDVPGTLIRYDLPITAAGLGLAVVAVAGGLLVVGFGRLSLPRIVLGGFVTGVGVAATHYTSVAAVRVSGELSIEPRIMLVSVIVAVAGSSLALWWTQARRGGAVTFLAAAATALAACGMHYIAIAPVHVNLTDTVVVGGMSPFALLMPISLFACIMITALAYATVGSSVQLENLREEELLAQVRELHGEAALALPHPGSARHR